MDSGSGSPTSAQILRPQAKVHMKKDLDLERKWIGTIITGAERWLSEFSLHTMQEGVSSLLVLQILPIPNPPKVR
jgi:hypothetical protein